jgi:hypothetical protein
MEDMMVKVCPECGHPLRALERSDVTTDPCYECEGPRRHLFTPEAQLTPWLSPGTGTEEDE